MHLDDFITELRTARRNHDLLAAEDLVRQAVNERPLAGELGDPCTSRILHAEPGLLVLHAVVMPEYCTAPHDHKAWSLVGVYEGEESNVFYERLPDSHQIQRTGGRTITKGDVLILDEGAIHSIANSRRKHLMALHVYGANIFALERSAWDQDGLHEERFDFAKHAGGPLVKQ